jgi:hypothetical protein
MAQLIVVYWRDIPSQVIASAGRRNQVKVLLPDRFQEAVDTAAMRGGGRETDAYLADWRKSDPETIGDGLQEAADGKAAALEADYPPERLRALVKNGGYTPD